MTRRVLEKLCAKKVCVDFLAPIGTIFFGIVWHALGNYYQYWFLPKCCAAPMTLLQLQQRLAFAIWVAHQENQEYAHAEVLDC